MIILALQIQGMSFEFNVSAPEYSTNLEPHNPLIRAVYTPSVVRCICRMLNSTDLANWRCFYMRDLK